MLLLFWLQAVFSFFFFFFALCSVVITARVPAADNGTTEWECTVKTSAARDLIKTFFFFYGSMKKARRCMQMMRAPAFANCAHLSLSTACREKLGFQFSFSMASVYIYIYICFFFFLTIIFEYQTIN